MSDDITPRKAQPDHTLNEKEFKKKYLENFFDPRFQSAQAELEKITEIAWGNYKDHRKAPITVKAGDTFQDPEYDLSAEWLASRNKLNELQKQWPSARAKILIINGSPRNQNTCPGETSKSYRLIQHAKAEVERQGMLADILDLSELTSEYGKNIHPCKGCVSSAMPLCHWPCSCYPNHSLGQTQDWMSEVYEKWVGAHGIMIVTPVHWYQAPSGLKLMIDRLVCADGGNPDPTSTSGKNILKAKKLELAGWDYPKHLAGRAFSVVVHGDAAGVEQLRRTLTDWLTDMELIQAGASALVDTYIGYYEPYATSHAALDKDKDLFTEVGNAALALTRQVGFIRSGEYKSPDAGIHDPKQK